MKKSLRLVSALLFVLFICSMASAAVPSLTMLSTETCPACKQMLRVFDELKADYKNKLSTSHIYLENNQDIAKKYNVRYVPMLIFRDASGNVIAKEIGYRSASEVVEIFAKAGIKI